jgi:hypothetical protein
LSDQERTLIILAEVEGELQATPVRNERSFLKKVFLKPWPSYQGRNSVWEKNWFARSLARSKRGPERWNSKVVRLEWALESRRLSTSLIMWFVIMIFWDGDQCSAREEWTNTFIRITRISKNETDHAGH